MLPINSKTRDATYRLRTSLDKQTKILNDNNVNQNKIETKRSDAEENVLKCEDCSTLNKVCGTAYESYSVPHPFPVIAYVTQLKPQLDQEMKNLIVKHQFHVEM